MIGIEEIAHYFPEGSISNLDRREQFGVDDDFLRDKIGVKHVRRKRPDEETSDLCARAFEALREKGGPEAAEIDCLVVCTQNPDGRGLPHTAAVVHGKLGCQDGVAAFDVSLGCSGYVYGVGLVAAFMQANGLRRGLLFTADPYSKIVDPDDRNTAMLFSDAATVTVLGERPRLVLRRARFATRGTEGGNLQNVDGTLQMNGRAIFNFTMTAVPAQIRALLEEEGLSFDEIDLFAFHQASRYLLTMMSRRLGIPPERLATNLEDAGNTVSSSVPLLLEEPLAREEIRRVLVSGFGVGLSWASAILERANGGNGR